MGGPGDSYAKVNDYANAGLSYERLQVFYSKDVRAPDALIKAAKYFELSADTSRAEISLLNVVQDYSATPDYFEATFQLGNLYFNSGEISKAEDQYKALLSSDNDSVRVMGLLALGRLSERQNAFAQAEKYFQDATKLNIVPWSTDAVLESIELNIDAGNYSLALNRASQMDVSELTTEQNEKLEFEKVYASLAESPVGGTGSDSSLYATSLPEKLKTFPTNYKIKLASLLNVKKRYADGISLLRNVPSKELDEDDVNLYAELAFRAGKMELSDSLLSWYVSHAKDPSAKSVVKLLDVETRAKNSETMIQKGRSTTRLVEQTFYSYQKILSPRSGISSGKDFPDVYLYYKARYEDGDGNYDDAMVDYRELLASYPESDYAAEADSTLNYISNFKNVDYKNAVAGLADIVSEQAISSANPLRREASGSSALLQLGNLFANDLKDYGRAVKIYRELASVSTGDTARMAQYLLAGVLMKTSSNSDSNSEVFSIYKKLAYSPENDSITENSLYHVIIMQLASGDSIGVENSALSFLKRFPNSENVSNVSCVLAKSLYSGGAYHEAIVQASIAGSLPEAQLVIAKSEIAIDSLTSAKSALENLFSSEPSKKYLLDGQSLYIDLLKKMNLDASQAYLNFLAGLVPSYYKDKIAEQFADYLYATGRYDTAYSVYRTLGDDQLWYTTPPNVIYKMAYCELKSGNENAAKDLFQQVVTESQSHDQVSDSYNQLGKIYESLGDKRMSAAFFEKAGSSDAAALVTAGDTYFKIGDYDDAAQVYKQILSGTVDSLKAFSAARLIEVDYKNEKIASRRCRSREVQKKLSRERR